MRTEKQEKQWRVFQLVGMCKILTNIGEKYSELQDVCIWAKSILLLLKKTLEKEKLKCNK